MIVPRGHWCWDSTSLSQLADGLTYYSCRDYLAISFLLLAVLFLIAKSKPLILVDPEGFEPSTFSMPLRRAPNCAMGPYLLLSALLVDLRGFEPLTSSVRLRRAPNCATGPISRRSVFYLRHFGMSMKQGEIFAMHAAVIPAPSVTTP